MAKMIKITQQFAEANDGVMANDGVNKFGYGVTKGGEYFCSVNSKNTHPELFDGVSIDFIEVTKDDLPDPEPLP